MTGNMDFDRPRNVSFFDFAGGVQLLRGENARSVLPVILIVICWTGVIGNLLVLLSLIHDLRNGRASEVKALLAGLCSTDLLIVLLCAPVRAVTYYRQTWTLGSLLCQTADWFQHSCLVAKTFTLAATTRARRSFVSSSSDSIYFSPMQLYGVLVFIWIASLVSSTPLTMFTSLQPHHDIKLCVTEIPFCASGFMDVFYKIYPTLTYVVPILFTVVHYTKTLRDAKPKGDLDVTSAQPQNRGAAAVWLSVSGANTLMLLPEWSSWTWARLGYSYNYTPPVGFVIFSQVLMYSCSSLSPIIVLTGYEDVRHGLNSLWLFRTCRGSKRTSVSASPTTEENGEEGRRATVIYPLVDLKHASLETPEGRRNPRTDDTAARKIFPDLEHFWTERVNTHDPLPWESQEERSYFKS
uniref:G-protein coupled receptors family 1 profile domain-containing protein n=1 Tax=Hucho hucho TaxID=62062 RepID=A0A4W5P394_9TELE